MNKHILNRIACLLIILALASCDKGNFDLASDKNMPDGKSGSTARMTIAGNYLYAVDVRSLKVVNINNPLDPVYVKTIDVGMDIETIYPFKNHLFIGSNSGMYIYNIDNPENPVRMSQFSHVTACDPVIADDDYAFVTLRTTEICDRWQHISEIHVLDITSVSNPVHIRTYPTNWPPYGLDMNDDYLFVCHGSDGFAIYNKSMVIAGNTNALIKSVKGVNAYDAILYQNILFIIGESGFHQYDYSNITNPVLISSILAGN